MDDQQMSLLLLQQHFQQELETKNDAADHQFALLLQQHFNHEHNVNASSNSLSYSPQKKNHNSSKSLIDPSWELVDPTPNIHNLFIVFNERFFWNKLVTVCVDWSKRMTTCAGICSYQPRGGLCKITLSEPLLKLRPRKDLIETLLHEMIHAFLFVTHNNRDRDGHGPEFHKHMHRINDESGTKITVYHSFHDEVRLYQQHWWRCDGPCQKWKPYFGMVRRAMNRAPGPTDRWWGQHSRSCGGTFIKVKEPEKVVKKKKQEKENVKPKNNSDIRSFVATGNKKKPTSSSIKTDTGKIEPNNLSQPVPKSNNIHGFVSWSPTKVVPTSKTFNDNTKIKNIHGFHDIDKLKKGNAKGGTKTMNAGNLVSNKKPSTITKPDDTENIKETQPIQSFTGSGRTLGTSTPPKDYSTVRNHWLNKFTDKSNKRTSPEAAINLINPKRPKDDLNTINVCCPVCNADINETLLNEHLDTCLLVDNPKDEKSTIVCEFSTCVVCDETIPTKEYPKHLSDCFKSDNFFIEDEPEEESLLECDICNEFFNAKRLDEHVQACLQNISICIGNESFNHKECGVCHMKVNENIFDRHMESCLLKMFDDMERKRKGSVDEVSCLVCSKKISKDKLNEHLDECMSNDIFKSNEDAEDFCNDDSLIKEYENSSSVIFVPNKTEEVIVLSDDEKISFINDTSLIDEYDSGNKKVSCPICNKSVVETDINAHLDICIN